MGVTDADEPLTIVFRRSVGREIVHLAIALPAATGAGVGINLATGDKWWDGLWMPLLWFLIFRYSVRLARPSASGHQARLPLRLSGEHLEVAGSGGSVLAIEWSNIARAEIRGRWRAFLVIEPADPDQTRPPLKRWEWAGHGQSRPYEILVPLVNMSPGRDLLRRELARQLPATAAEPEHAP
ncbi:hypothetical protein [Micromonospora sp. NPDC005189]|uniref:hypothetical protein n=1 Tax=unclassified Micromonospora TaxID=2617518 RepID=UPI0033A6F9E4